MTEQPWTIRDQLQLVAAMHRVATQFYDNRITEVEAIEDIVVWCNQNGYLCTLPQAENMLIDALACVVSA